NVVALLKFARGHRVVELIRMSERARQAEQERGVRVEIVRRRTAVESGYAVDEVESATGPVTTDLRLPVVHLMVDVIQSGADAMRTVHPIDVCGVCIEAIVALDRAPVIHMRQRCVAADIENREAALPRVGAVRAGNLENVRAVIGSVIR